uniref:Protein FAR1-RELATED SEQUENCE n=1 Tax=Aegilops tauschii TaxID=37682 RepID=M8AUI0_AEGTA
MPMNSFCSQPVAAVGVLDLALPEGGEEDDECGDGGKDGDSYSPSSSSASQVHEAIEDFFNVPDIDQTDSHREHPSESQRTPTLWPQRARLGKIPDRRASLSGRKSALEKAMRNFADKKSGTVNKPEISQEFDSLDEAYDFYNLYSWETGFGIKYGQCRRNVDKCKTVQVFGCQVVNIFDSRHVNLAVLQGRVHFPIVLM